MEAALLSAQAPADPPQAATASPEVRSDTIPFVDDFEHDGSVSEWRARPVDRILPATASRPQALLWIGQVPEGLVVAAEVRSGTPFARPPLLQIRLAGPDSLRLPPIGWGHQFGFEVLPDSLACEQLEWRRDPAGCRDWYRAQLAWRENLPPLFIREWHVAIGAPGEVLETRATGAFADLEPSVRERLVPLAPRGMPIGRGHPIAGTRGGIGLEVLVPWSAFPPVPAPDLGAVRLEVGWEESGELPDAESPAADPLAPAGLRGGFFAGTARPLARVLHHRITSCEYGLAGLWVTSRDDRAGRAASPGAVPYMIPTGDGELRSLILLDNEAAGYLYDPLPGTLSPVGFETSWTVLDVGRGERLCLPPLALARDGGRVSPPDWTHSGEGDPPRDMLMDPGGVHVRREPDGDLLVKSGPRVLWSWYGSGQCGACPQVEIGLYHVSAATGEVTPLFEWMEVAVPEESDIEVAVSGDWSTVTVYRSSVDPEAAEPRPVWSEERFCRPAGGHAPDAEKAQEGFLPCGRAEDVEPPPARLRARYAAPEPPG